MVLKITALCPCKEIDGFEKYTATACEYKNMYDFKLGNLMDYYGIETEAEIISGNILKMSKSFNERKDLEGINHAVMSLRKETRSWFNVMVNKSNSQSHQSPCRGHMIASPLF